MQPSPITFSTAAAFSPTQLAQLRTVIADELAALVATTVDDTAWLWTPLDQQTAAAFLGVDRSTLSTWTRAGQVPHSYVGKWPRYLRGELLPLLRAGRLPLPLADDEAA